MHILDDSPVTRRELNQYLTTMINSIKQSIDKRFDEFGIEIAGRFDGMDRRLDAMDWRFDGVDQRFNAMDRRFETMDERFDGIDRRLDAMDERFDGMDRRLDAMDRRFDTVESILLRQSEQLRILIEKS